MKLNLSFLTGTASLAMLISGAFADSAVTDPVGYITLTITGAASPTSPSSTLISPTMVNKIEFAGVSSNNPSGTPTISTTSTLPVGLDSTYVLELKGGAQEGWWSTIASVSGGNVTVQSNFPAGLAIGQSFIIRKHQTVAGFLGANAPGLLTGVDLSADEVQLLDGQSQVVSAFFYATVADGAPVAGWYDAGGASADATIIPPGNSVLVKRKVAGDKTFVQVGHVKTTKTQIGVWKGYNWLTPMAPTGTTLAALNLDTGNLATGVQRGLDLSVDELQLIAPSQVVSAFFAADPVAAGDPLLTGWFDSGGAPAGTTPMTEANGAIVVRKVNQTAIWTAPAPTIAP